MGIHDRNMIPLKNFMVQIIVKRKKKCNIHVHNSIYTVSHSNIAKKNKVK